MSDDERNLNLNSNSSGFEIEFKADIGTLWDMLEEHNWSYWESKDDKEYQEGAEWWSMILKHADTPEKKQLVQDFEKHIHSGTPYGSEKFPKPDRPQE